jgi:mannosyltransferase
VSVIVLVGAALRLKDLTTASLWWDEFATLAQVRGSFAEMIAATASDTYPPGYNVLAWVAVHLFGTDEWSLRLPALLAGIAAIGATYWLGAIVGGRTTGWLAALLLALSPFAIIHSHDARMYSLLLLGAALAATAAIRLLQAPSWPRAAVLTAANALLLYSHPYGFLSWVAMTGAILLLVAIRPQIRRGLAMIVVAEAAGAVAFLPWALILMGVARELGEGGFWIDRPSVWDGIFALKVIAGGLFLALLLLPLLVVAVARRARLPGDQKAVSWAILVALAAGPPLIGFLVSQVTTPIFIPRYLACSVPALVVLAAWGGTTLATNWRGLTAVVSATILLGAAAILTEPKSFGENWRGLASHLTGAMQSTDCLLVHPGRGEQAIRYYMNELPACFVEAARFASAPLEPNIGRVFAVFSHTTDTVAGLKKRLGADWEAKSRSFGGVRLVTFEQR